MPVDFLKKNPLSSAFGSQGLATLVLSDLDPGFLTRTAQLLDNCFDLLHLFTCAVVGKGQRKRGSVREMVL